MTDQHPITPPPELVHQWANHSASVHRENGTYEQHEFAIATQAARWGADTELEACCEYMQHEDFHGFAKELRAARRPKPTSLKEQALLAIDTAVADGRLSPDVSNAVRRALEQLDD